MAKKEKWIQKAIKRPGRLRKLAQREGGLTKDGEIKTSWLIKKKAETKDPSLKRAINLALTLEKLRKRGK